MTCELVRERLGAYVDGQLYAVESSVIRNHLVACDECFQEYEYQARLDSPLRELPAATPAPELATAIRLRAFPSARPSFWDRWQVHLSNLMRPVALPAVGGLLTALILFGALLPGVADAWQVYAAAPHQDTPTDLLTQPRFKEASPFLAPEDLLVEAWIDERGNIMNFEVLSPTENGSTVEKMLLLESGNVFLTTKFEPATRFGQPTASKVVFRISRINIRG